MTLPLDPFGRSRMPGDIDRETRVRLIGEAFEALIEGRMPSPEAARFLGTKGLAWLNGGGSLERDHLRVIKRHSHHTPARLWALLTGKAATSSAMNDTDQKPAEDSSSTNLSAEAAAFDLPETLKETVK